MRASDKTGSRYMVVSALLFTAILAYLVPLGRASEAPTWNVSLQVDAVQPAGSPVLLTVVHTNAGPLELSREYNGPGLYLTPEELPNAGKVRVLDSQGRAREVLVANGQRSPNLPGSFLEVNYKPGESSQTPVAIDPLPVGSYQIEMSGLEPVRIEVRADVALRQQREESWFADQARRNPRPRQAPFALYLQSHYDAPYAGALALRELMSPDAKAATNAAYVVTILHSVPDDAVAFIDGAILKYLGQDSIRYPEDRLLEWLARAAAKVGSDAALDAVLAVAYKQTFGPRVVAVASLGKFKQDRAAQELHYFLTAVVSAPPYAASVAQEVRYAAATTLARRDDPAGLRKLHDFARDPRYRYEAAMLLADHRDNYAIDALIAELHDKKSHSRAYVFQGLMKFPHDPRTLAAIREGIHDSNADVRDWARRALDMVQGKRHTW